MLDEALPSRPKHSLYGMQGRRSVKNIGSPWPLAHGETRIETMWDWHIPSSTSRCPRKSSRRSPKGRAELQD
jgi:hypothetical protein